MVTGVDADGPSLAVPVQAAANLKRSVIISLPLGAIVLVLLAYVGHSLAGWLVFVGLALGALNTWLVQRSVVHYGESSAINRKKRFIGGVFGRLGLITLIAAVVLLLARVDGLGVLAGLALFQLVMLGGAVVPLMKELRRA